MVQLPSLPPERLQMPGGFFASRFFQIFIKFYGSAVFLYSTVIPDFLKIESWLRNSVHTMTPRHGSIVLGGGRVGVKCGQVTTVNGIRQRLVVY